jgi:hypothetical protein
MSRHRRALLAGRSPEDAAVIAMATPAGRLPSPDAASASPCSACSPSVSPSSMWCHWVLRLSCSPHAPQTTAHVNRTRAAAVRTIAGSSLSLHTGGETAAGIDFAHVRDRLHPCPDRQDSALRRHRRTGSCTAMTPRRTSDARQPCVDQRRPSAVRRPSIDSVNRVTSRPPTRSRSWTGERFADHLRRAGSTVPSRC